MVEGLAVDLVHLDGSAVLMVRGEIDMATSPVLGAALERTMALGVPVVLDFAGVTFMDSSGLNVLLLAGHAVDRPGSVTVRNPSPLVRRLLTVTRLDGLVGPDASFTADTHVTDAKAETDSSSDT